MQVVHFGPKIWEILLVLVIGLPLMVAVAKNPKFFWPLLIIVNILGMGPSLMKYFFWDKALTGFIILGALQYRPADESRLRTPVIRDDHKLVFCLWIGYMIMESAIGMIVNSDPRIIFWVIFYALLGVLAYILCHRRRDFPFPSVRQFAIIVLATVLFYNTVYLGYGIFIEKILGVPDGRFAAQFLFRDSFVWAPPSISTYPFIIGMPAVILVMNDRSFKVRMLALASLLFMIAVGFYYDSRAAYIIIFCIFLVSLPKIRFFKIIAIILVFIPAFYYFMGSIKIQDFFSKEIFSGMQIMWSPTKRDAPRQKHTVAALLRITDNVGTFFVGDGLYSHKLTIKPYIEQLYENIPPVAPITIQSQHLRDDEFMRTNAFSALLIDTGIIGMLILISLFLFTAYKIMVRKGPYRVLILVTLLMTFMWQFIINMTGILLFYLLFMPCGLLDQLSKVTCVKPTRIEL